MTHLSPPELLLMELGMMRASDIDLEIVAASQDVTVLYRNLTSSEARIMGREDTAVVTVDRRRGWPRARFSLAHELGHWHHHRGKSFICRSEDIGAGWRGPNDPERVADSYAADLVLPPFMVRAPIASLKTPSIEAIRSFANDFRASITATALRFVRYHPTPLVVVCHGLGRRRWKRANPRITWKLRDEVDDRSPSFNVLYGDAQLSRPTNVNADLWFDRRWADRYQVREQSFKASDSEIVTLLAVQEPAMLE